MLQCDAMQQRCMVDSDNGEGEVCTAIVILHDVLILRASIAHEQYRYVAPIDSLLYRQWCGQLVDPITGDLVQSMTEVAVARQVPH